MITTHQSSLRTIVCSEKQPRRLLAIWAIASGITLAASVNAPHALAQSPARKPNIVVIMADDVGIWNISAYHRGMMGGQPADLHL